MADEKNVQVEADEVVEEKKCIISCFFMRVLLSIAFNPSLYGV
jgi:hypothetical protein